MESSTRETARLLAVTVLWSATFHVLSTHGALALPRAVAGTLTLESFLAIVHVLTLAVGLLAARWLLAEPRRDLGLVPVPATAFATALGLTPAVFAGVTTAAFLIARPTLLAELLAGGKELVQQSTGRFGRELVQSPAPLALLWGAVLSPVSEELFFRGALFTLVDRLLHGLFGAVVPERPLDDAAPPSLAVPVHDGPLTAAARRLARLGRNGGGATLLVALAFGLLHRDMPGGLGIVRFVAALGLGLACGIARMAGGSVFLPMALHGAFNALSLAAVRRWVVTDLFPLKWGAPTLVTAMSVPALVAVVALRALARAPGRQPLASSSSKTDNP